MLKLEHRLGAFGTHVLNCVLVTNVVRPFNGVVHVPTPIVVWIITRDGTGNSTLSGYGVRPGGEYLADYRGL